jgi:hypothetical protein
MHLPRRVGRPIEIRGLRRAGRSRRRRARRPRSAPRRWRRDADAWRRNRRAEAPRAVHGDDVGIERATRSASRSLCRGCRRGDLTARSSRRRSAARTSRRSRIRRRSAQPAARPPGRGGGFASATTWRSPPRAPRWTRPRTDAEGHRRVTARSGSETHSRERTAKVLADRETLHSPGVSVRDPVVPAAPPCRRRRLAAEATVPDDGVMSPRTSQRGRRRRRWDDRAKISRGGARTTRSTATARRCLVSVSAASMGAVVSATRTRSSRVMRTLPSRRSEAGGSDQAGAVELHRADLCPGLSQHVGAGGTARSTARRPDSRRRE